MTPSRKIAIIRALIHARAIKIAKAEAEARGKYSLTFKKEGAKS